MVNQVVNSKLSPHLDTPIVGNVGSVILQFQTLFASISYSPLPNLSDMAAAAKEAPKGGPKDGMELDPKYDDYDFPVVAPVFQNGHPGHLTAAQQAQVHQLRLMLEAQGYTKRLDTLTLVLTSAIHHSV